jgi:hypothetical protein
LQACNTGSGLLIVASRIRLVRSSVEKVSGGAIDGGNKVVSKREVVSSDERASESCLHCEINDLIQDHVDCQETVDMAEVAARMAESLVDFVLRAPEEQQAKLLAATIAYVGQAFLEKTGGDRRGFEHGAMILRPRSHAEVVQKNAGLCPA